MPHKPNSENTQKPSENTDFIVLCQYLMKILLFAEKPNPKK